MLRRARASLLGLLTVGVSFVAAAPASHADTGGVSCPPEQPICVVVVTGPGGTSPTPTPSGNGGGGSADCRMPGTGEQVACYLAQFGWWSNSQGCYFRVADPQPAGTDPVWEGHFPAGHVYIATCLAAGGTGGGWLWLPTPPDGFGGGPSPATLAQRALDSMRLDGPAIGMAPGPGKTGLVGLPVWLWTQVSASTWGPISASASIPGTTVTATARAVRIVWDMGDGHSVTCTNPGTPYATASGGGASPTCGYVYTRSSADQPDHAYAVTATTTWSVSWVGGGQSGVLGTTRVSRTSVRIGELQVLVS